MPLDITEDNKNPTSTGICPDCKVTVRFIHVLVKDDKGKTVRKKECTKCHEVFANK